ncbi:hypothetical protein D9M68_644400 [compost metagenome]
MYRDLVAVLDSRADLVDVREVEFGRNALRVEVERDVHEVEVAGALAVAEEAAFDALCACHQGQFTGCGAGAAVVVRVHAQHDGVAAREVAVHPLDHVREDVRRGMLDRGGQVDDALALGRRRPHRGDRIDHALGEDHVGAREHLGRVLEGPLRVRLLCGEVVEHAGMAAREFDDLVFVHAEHHAAHHGGHRVVEVDDGARCTLQGFEGAFDEVVARLREHLDRHVVGNAVFFDELAHEVEFDLRRRGKADFDFLEADGHEGFEHAHLARDVHGLDQGLVAIAQVRRQPDRGLGQHGIGPGAVLETDRGECAVFGLRLLEHVDFSVMVGTQPATPKDKRPVAGANGP